MTLQEAHTKGYKILSGPYTPRQEAMMLAAKNSLGQTEHKVVTEKGSWYIVRQHMVEVPEDGGAKVRVRLSEDARSQIEALAAKSHAGQFSVALEFIVQSFFKVPKVCPSKKLKT